jgi:hypothetical protein
LFGLVFDKKTDKMMWGVNGMKRMSHWGRPIALFAVVLSTVGGMKATATVLTSTATDNRRLGSEAMVLVKRNNVQLAQRRGECRAAARSTFIYQERSTTNRIRAIQSNEQVILAEAGGRDGWIAVSSPISGFVQTQDLKRCGEVSTLPARRNLCRQVIYEGVEGVAVREKPDISSSQVSTVFFGDRVTLSNPPEFITDGMGREWSKLAEPSVGWMSNGIPARGDINLVACFQE